MFRRYTFVRAVRDTPRWSVTDQSLFPYADCCCCAIRRPLNQSIEKLQMDRLLDSYQIHTLEFASPNNIQHSISLVFEMRQENLWVDNHSVNK